MAEAAPAVTRRSPAAAAVQVMDRDREEFDNTIRRILREQHAVGIAWVPFTALGTELKRAGAVRPAGSLLDAVTAVRGVGVRPRRVNEQHIAYDAKLS